MMNRTQESTGAQRRRGLLLTLLAASALGVAGMPRWAPAAHTKAETEAPADPEPAPPAAPAEQAAGPLSTPKGALKAYDAALPAGGLEAARAAYHYDGEQEKQMAEAMARLDLATSQLQAKVKQKLGIAAVAVILHAARNESLTDLQDATAKIDGDRATIAWKDRRPPVPMILVDGKWKVSVGQLRKDLGKDADVADFVQNCDDVARQLRHTTEELSAGEYPNVTLLERAVQQRMYRVLGEDKP